MISDVIRQLKLLPQWEAYEKHCASVARNLTPSPEVVRDDTGDESRGVENPSVPHGPCLALMDLLIKPIQRICKYPLLFGSLCEKDSISSQPKAFLPSDHKNILDRCKPERKNPIEKPILRVSQAMQAIARRVDDASRTHELANKTRLIRRRLEQHPVGFHPYSPIYLCSLWTILSDLNFGISY
jgi:hypothetical protein